MEKRSEAQRIAVIEPCVMTETALRFILNDRYNENSSIHFFKDVQSLTQTMNIRQVTAIIFSLSGHRQLRLESLLFFQEALIPIQIFCELFWRIAEQSVT